MPYFHWDHIIYQTTTDPPHCRLRPSRRNVRYAPQAREKENQRHNREAREFSLPSEPNSPNNAAFPTLEHPNYAHDALRPIAQTSAGEGLPPHPMPQEPRFHDMSTFQSLPLPQPSVEGPPNLLIDAIGTTSL